MTQMGLTEFVDIVHSGTTKDWTNHNEAAFASLFGTSVGRYSKACEKVVALRAPKSDPESSVPFSAIIHHENPTSGPYHGLSFVIFPAENGPCLLGLVGRKGRDYFARRGFEGHNPTVDVGAAQTVIEVVGHDTPLAHLGRVDRLSNDAAGAATAGVITAARQQADSSIASARTTARAGAVVNASDRAALEGAQPLKQLSYVTGDKLFPIAIPPLTLKERSELDRRLPSSTVRLPFPLAQAQIDSYRSLYRYYPLLAEIDL
jgi:hypothetical protein